MEEGDSSSLESEHDWTYGKYQEDNLRARIQQKEATLHRRCDVIGSQQKKAPIVCGHISTKAQELGVQGTGYPRGLVVVPDGCILDSDGGEDTGSRQFNPSRYLKYRELLDKLEESKFYEAFIAHEPTIAVDDLTMNVLLKGFSALNYHRSPSSGSTSIDPLPGLLDEYRKFRVQQLRSWYKNIEKYGQKIFNKEEYETDEMAPKRSKEILKMIKFFTSNELSSFDRNPYTYYILPCQELMPPGMVDEARKADKPEHYSNKHNFSSISGSPVDDRLFYPNRKRTTFGAVDTNCNVPGFPTAFPGKQPLARKIREFLSHYPLGIHCTKFMSDFELYIGRPCSNLHDRFRPYPGMLHKEKDILWGQEEPEFPVVCELEFVRSILFPAHLSHMIEEMLQLTAEIWFKYRAMVILEARPLPFDESTWNQFESFLAGCSSDWFHVFHYTDWGFETQESFVVFCLKKWRNEDFHILNPGTLVQMKRSTQKLKLTEQCIFFGKRENFVEPELPRFKPVPQVTPTLPIGYSLQSAAIESHTKQIKVGEVHLFSAGTFKYPHQFGVIATRHYYNFKEHFQPKLQKFYEENKADRTLMAAAGILARGKAVVVLYRKEWTRATIIKSLRMNNYMVYLMDWATFVFVSLENMRYLKTDFMTFQTVGVLCKLIVPEELQDCGYDGDRRWDDIVSKKFILCMKDKFVSLKFINKTIFQDQILWEVQGSQLNLAEEFEITHAVIPDISAFVFLGRNADFRVPITRNKGGVLGLQEAAQRKVFYCESEDIFGNDEDIIEVPDIVLPVPVEKSTSQRRTQNERPVEKSTSQRRTQNERDHYLCEFLPPEAGDLAQFDSGDEWNAEDFDEEIMEPSADWDHEVLGLNTLPEPRKIFDIITAYEPHKSFCCRPPAVQKNSDSSSSFTSSDDESS